MLDIRVIVDLHGHASCWKQDALWTNLRMLRVGNSLKVERLDPWAPTNMNINCLSSPIEDASSDFLYISTPTWSLVYLLFFQNIAASFPTSHEAIPMAIILLHTRFPCLAASFLCREGRKIRVDCLRRLLCLRRWLHKLC